MVAIPVPKRAWLAAITVSVLIAPPASAATLASPPITAAGGGLVECSIANVSGAAAKVTIRVIDNDAERTRASAATMAGHKSDSRHAFCKGICNRPRCEFETNKPAGTFRASACVADHTSTNTNKICLPAQ